MAKGALSKVQAGGVATLMLDRAGEQNALTLELLEALLRALTEAEADAAVRCVVLTGAGRDFSRGMDPAELERFRARSPSAFGKALRETLHPILLRIRSMEKPVVACVNGPASAEGASLALACDLRTASEDALFVLSGSRLGLLPSGMTGALVRRLGLAVALEHAWTGRPMTAQEALAAGLVNLVVPPYRLESSTFSLVRKLLEAPARAVALTKRAMNRAWAASLEEELDYEAQLQDILLGTRDHAEALAAVLGGRDPSFTGE